jgi:hypothetical protein
MGTPERSRLPERAHFLETLYRYGNLVVPPQRCYAAPMIHDLPLPLRLRNALAKAGFTTEQQLLDWLKEGTPLPGVGPTGLAALQAWAAKPAAVDASSRWAQGLEIREIKRQTAAFVAAGGSIEAGNGRGLLTLRLEAAIQAQISALIPTIKALPHVKELGVEVSAETVGRMALIRGLDALERAHNGQNPPGKAETKAKTADPSPEDVVPMPDPDTEVHQTPPGWSKCGPNDKIPVPEAVLHDYYTQNSWSRYWGMVDGTPIYFYWCPERRLQDLDPFPGSDKGGRKVAIQDTPWGPGHVVPVKWANS